MSAGDAHTVQLPEDEVTLFANVLPKDEDSEYLRLPFKDPLAFRCENDEIGVGVLIDCLEYILFGRKIGVGPYSRESLW